ncbi:WASH complex subunit 2 [Helicoverpa armigera]|uniref:WASH complex subunit 2 n=1 Tax=Helicoverpa armigera TaxID=29058 RepID=UPI00308317BF
MASRDEREGPVYYREIQKNAYLKRIPNDTGSSKLRPLSSKKTVPLKPMWTQLCVHNGRTPYLEQYPEASCPATMTHAPVWRACLSGARHVTASVTPRAGDQYDFLVDTDSGAVRMLAPDWESMQDWVTTLRNTLHELKILSPGENVYCAAPAPPPVPAPRAAARDPTSPLPPTPPTPPHRVPGIEITTRPAPEASRNEPTRVEPTRNEPTRVEPNRIEPNRVEPTRNEPCRIDAPRIEPRIEPTRIEPNRNEPNRIEPTELPQNSDQENIDISNWDSPFSSLPSTSQAKVEPRSLAKICGQNICLDDSIFKRKSVTDSDEEFFKEIDRLCDEEESEFRQTVLVSNGEKDGVVDSGSNHPATNITVIQVSNKEPPHTAIPVMGPETDVFDFEFKQKLTITDPPNPNFVNIVNTEQNEYGTTFSKNDSDYGHLSLTTTVNLTGANDSEFPTFPTQSTFPTPKSEELYERLCMASTSNSKPSPLPVKKLKSVEKSRKSSLPNLEVGDSTYEYLFLSNNNANTVSVNPEVNCNGDSSRVQVSSVTNEPINRLRSVERSRSQNAYDSNVRPREIAPRRIQNSSPKREIKIENSEQSNIQNKPIWKRGLTELSLLTRLKSIGLKKESPTRQDDQERSSSNVSSPVKVVHRSRPEVRVDSTRRRSSSLSNAPDTWQHYTGPPHTDARLTPLRARQVCAFRAEQRRGAALPAAVSASTRPVFVDYVNQVWIAWWGAWGCRWSGRAGDRVAAVAGRAPRDAAHATRVITTASGHTVDILFHRVPLGKMYVINKRDQEPLGLRLDNECNITQATPGGACSRAGVPPPGAWAVTEINNRPVNLISGGEDDMNRLSRHGTEVSILIQPSAFVKKLRSALKANKSLIGMR